MNFLISVGMLAVIVGVFKFFGCITGGFVLIFFGVVVELL